MTDRLGGSVDGCYAATTRLGSRPEATTVAPQADGVIFGRVREHFEIVVTRNNGRPVDLRRNGVLGPWTHRNQTRDSHTVAEFRQKFEESYPGYSCIVTEGTGKTATGQKSLGAVRTTY